MRKPDNASPGASRLLVIFAGTVVICLILALFYVGFQAMRVINPPIQKETALMATVEETVQAEGVLLFTETIVPGSDQIGYLVEDGERVSAGTTVAEVYTDPSQASLRVQLTELNQQIALLTKSQTAPSAQLDTRLMDRAAALYLLMDTLDQGAYGQTSQDGEAYLLAQSRLWVTTGEAPDLGAQIAALTAQVQTLQAQLGSPAQITAPVTGYFVRAGVARQLTQSAEAILALDAAGLRSLLDQGVDTSLTGCAGKMVSGFSWVYCGVCSFEEGQKLLGADGKVRSSKVGIRFPGQTEDSLSAKLTSVTLDEANGLARFTLQCDSITADLLRLGQADAEIILSETTGLRIRAQAVHYQMEQTEDADKGENYLPGVYVKFGNMARFCRIDPVDSEHPLVTDGEYIIVQPKGTEGSVSEVRLYDEIIVSGQNLYDGKLLY